MKKILLLSLIFAFAASLNAQTFDRKWGVGIGVGGYGTLNNGGIGFMPELSFSRYLSSQFDLMLKGDIGLFNTKLNNNLDLVNPFLNLRFKLSDENNKLRPYIFAGPGYLYNNTVSAFNFDLGLGGKYHLSPGNALYMEACYIRGIESEAKGITGRESLWKATLGMEFSFGKAKDSDHDGVPDKKDQCPQTPENVTVDINGCPLDTDNDGIVDYLDDCPTIKGISSLNGCPDLKKSGVNDLDLPIPEVKFYVNAPDNIPVERRVRETFPLRNYVFFNEGSTSIPDRYVLLKKNKVKDFKEDQLEVFTPKELSGRSSREMVVYYNILNILGDRMSKNPATTIRLSGASMEGPEDGKYMAESVKKYLVAVFGIDASRITTEGQIKPNIPSEKPGGTLELDLLREGDRRVTIESTSSTLLMEFQSGTASSLKPVEFNTVQKAPIDSYVTFNAEGSDLAFTSWRMEITDENNNVQFFGPYTKELVGIPGKSILKTKSEGDYKVMMIGKTKDNKIVKKEAPVHMVLWTPIQNEEGMRYSVIYEFNESKVIALYEKYLTDIIAPKIPRGGTVILHGHTDNIGDRTYNQKLSLARANDVCTILKTALAKLDRNDVKFDVKGFGEEQTASTLDNKLPEERFYNRTVIIDIIPGR